MISVLDCTLRDGGYINNWGFDNFNFGRITRALKEANIDIIECGYLGNNYRDNSTIFKNTEMIEGILKETYDKEKLYVAMINQGEYDVNILSQVKEESLIKGIRVVFKKQNMKSAFEDIKILKKKGYKVFVQAMVTLSYSDLEILELIKLCNEEKIYSLYIVDSFGAMNPEDIIRLSYIINNNLNDDIIIGFHAHNNLQLAYINAMNFIEKFNKRNIIIDSSILGMGRGAGNLPTELITNYLNTHENERYKIEPVLDIIDKYVSRINLESPWGYSISYYLSGIYNCHPNYASYLVNKNTMTIANIEKILKLIESDKKISFDKNYIENLYIKFNSKKLKNYFNLESFKKSINGKDIILVGPGTSLKNFEFNKFDRTKRIFIGVNNYNEEAGLEYIFFSNNKRIDEFTDKYKNCDVKKIITSNLNMFENEAISVSYEELLADKEEVKDNALLMILNLFKKIHINNVYLVGFDGYKYSESNYLDRDMDISINKKDMDMRNSKIKEQILKMNSEMDIYFLTNSIYNQEK